MSIRVSGAALGELQKLFGWGAMGAWTDSQLVEQFLAGEAASEAAFRVLIHRHGPMVLAVCRRILGDEHAAEDAFQATFLVFVKKAGRLKDLDLLTSWLYGVAMKVSHKERARGARRRVVERQAAERAPERSSGRRRATCGRSSMRRFAGYRNDIECRWCCATSRGFDMTKSRNGWAAPWGPWRAGSRGRGSSSGLGCLRRGLAPSASAMAARAQAAGGWLRPALARRVHAPAMMTGLGTVTRQAVPAAP